MIGIPETQQRKQEILALVKSLYYSQSVDEYRLSLPNCLEKLRSISEQITNYLLGTWLGESAQYVNI
jgi:hypothetical protein